MSNLAHIDVKSVPLVKKRAVEAVNLALELLGRPSEEYVKAFKDTAESGTKVLEVQAALVEKFGYGELYQDRDSGAVSWVTEKPTEPVQAEPQAAPAEKKAATGQVGKTNLDLTAEITVLKDNPKRPGSKAHAIFACYTGEGGAKVNGEQFLKAVEALNYSRGDALANLQYDHKRGFIQIGAAAPKTEEPAKTEESATGSAPAGEDAAQQAA